MCGRPSPSKAFTTTPSEEPSPAPIGTRQGWSSGSLKDGVRGQLSRSPQNLAVSAMPAPLFSGSPRILPHFTDVETEARRRAGIPQKFAQQVPGSYSTPSPGLVGTTQQRGGPATQGRKSHADPRQLCVPGQAIPPLCASVSLSMRR